VSREALPLDRARQGTALALTILALILSVGAYALAGMGRRGHIPVNLALYGSIFALETGSSRGVRRVRHARFVVLAIDSVRL